MIKITYFLIIFSESMPLNHGWDRTSFAYPFEPNLFLGSLFNNLEMKSLA